MQKKVIVPINQSLGFSLRGIRAQSDYLKYLSQKENLDIVALILAPSNFRSLLAETFSIEGVRVTFLNPKDEGLVLDSARISEIAKQESVPEDLIITESNAVRQLQNNGNYLTVTDNLGQPHPYPSRPIITVRSEVVDENLRKLDNFAKLLIKDSDAKLIFISFSGLKSFGTDYGKDKNQKDRIKKFMTFPLENIIPAIGEIQLILRKKNIIAFPISIQYGDLEVIGKAITAISLEKNLSPLPTSMGIDWNNDLEQQVGFFHALNRWSEKNGLPNISIVHGSSCLHMIEECSEHERMVVFFATHTHELAPEDDGRIYHFDIAKKAPKFLRVAKPPTLNSHNYKLVASQIVNEVSTIFN